MDKAEKQRRQEKARRQSIFDNQGNLLPRPESRKRSICNVHLWLAYLISESDLPAKSKEAMLRLVDEAYNMGKRMDNRLDIYRAETGQEKDL